MDSMLAVSLRQRICQEPHNVSKLNYDGCYHSAADDEDELLDITKVYSFESQIILYISENKFLKLNINQK